MSDHGLLFAKSLSTAFKLTGMWLVSLARVFVENVKFKGMAC